METGPDISEAISYNGRICQADEITRQAEMVISDDKKQLQKGEKIEAVEEAGIEITEVEEINKRAIPGDKNHDTVNVTGTSSQMAKTEEENLNIEGHETLKDERVHDQHVEVISNQQASIEEIPQSTEKEMKDAQKEEEREKVVDKDTLVESSEEVISILEATVVQTSKASVHTKDLTVNNLNKDVETVTDLCTKDETIDKSSTADTTLFQEGLGETKLKGVEYKETEKYSDLVAEEKGPETIRPSEEIGNKDKKDKVMYDRIEDASFSTKEESPNIQNDEGTTLDIGDGDKDKPEKSSVIPEQCRASQQEDGPEVGEKIKDACSTECEEKKQDATELNKQEKDVTSVEDEMQNKKRLDTSFVKEETSQQEVDNSEIFKVDPKIGLENIVMESTKEVTNPNEIFEKFAQADSSASENSKDVENYDKNPDASSGTCEDGMQSKAEDLDVTEASAGETREKEGFTVMVNEDNISKTDFIKAMKLSKLESKEHEGGPEHNLLQQNEPEKKELERPSNKISEEIETGASRENTEFENPEDSFKEKRQDDKSTATYDTTSVEIPGQKNPPLIDSNEKTESSEAEIPNNNANNLHVTHSLVEETGQVQGKRIDEVFEFEPEEEIQKLTCTSTDEENQAANASEAYKSTEGTVIEHSSAEGTVRMETNITEKLETVYGLESDEKLEVSDAQANIPEVTHKEEAIVTGNDIEEGSLENDSTKVAHSVYTGDKTVEQSLPVRSLMEPAPTLSSEDERSNIILEELQDGHKIPVPGSGDVNKEQIFEANATFFTPKPIEKETTKIYQDSEKETKISREEDGSLEIMKEGQVDELSPESTGKGPIQDFEVDEKEAYKDEILEKSQPARAGGSIAHETNHDESPEEILQASLAKQEEGLQGEVEHLVSTEASAENGDEDASSVKVTEDNNDNNNIGLAEATENSAKVTPQGEEDSEEGLQIDETASIVVESPENILIASLVKQKEDLQEESEKLDSTEASIKNNDEETYSIKMAEENDENNKQAEKTEASVKVTPKGEEDSEHALQHDEPQETKHEFESPGEVLDTSLVNPGKGLQGESTNLAQAETSQEKRVEGISSVKVVVDNDRLAETTENRAKATPEGEEDSDQILQKDEPGEGITRETNNGAEIPENISSPTLVTQEEGLHGESENLAPTEAAMEKRDEATSYIKVTEDNDDNEQAEDTKNSEKVTPEGGEDSEKILQIDEPGQSIVGMENRDVDSPEGEEDSEHALQHDEPRETNHEFESPGEVLDTSLVGKGLQGESTNLAPAETSQEKRDEGISSVKIVVDNDRLVETTENSAKATPEGEEDSNQILQKDEPAEGITRETNNGAVSDPTLVKQEEGLQEESENLAPRTEVAIEKREEESYIKVTEDNANNEQAEVTENSEKVTPEGGEDSEKILQTDEPGQSIVGMENRNVDSPEGEEDSEQALQHYEPRETNHEFESPREILDTSLVNPGKGLQGQSTNLAQAETSQEKRDEAITSVKVAVDNDDNDKLAEAMENSAKATPKGEANLEQILQKYEPGEGITHETNNGVEVLETISDPQLVKQEEGLEGESENLAPTEAAIEKRDEDTSYIKVVEDNNDNGQAEAIENSEKETPEGGEDSEKILQINEPGQNIVGMENRNVDSPENNLDTLFVKQEEVLQGEGYNSVPTKTSIENSDEDTFSVKVAEKNDENNRLAETMEDSVKVTPKGEENSEQVLQKDDPQEKYHNVESPDNILDKSLLNLEEDLHVDGKDLAPTEASIENKDEDSSLVKVAEHKDGNNRQDEARENNADGTPKGEEDSEHVLQKDAVDESIACETDHEVEKHEKALNTPLAKQEECPQGQDENMIPTEASIEKRDGEISSTKIAEGNDGINGVAEAEGNSVKETAKGGEELEPVFQRDANDKLEQVLDVTPEEMEAESSSENMKKTTCMKEEGIIQNLEETSEREKREETETTDDKKEKEAAREKTFDATTSIDKGNRELILEEIDSVKDQSPEFNEKETTEENSKDQQECRGLGTTASSIEEEKPNLEEPGIAELSSSSVGEVIVKELKEEVKGPNLEFIEQIGAKDLTEESKSGTLQDSEEQNKNFSTLIIAETSSFVPDIFEKMIKEQILKQEEHTNNDFDSASVIILSEETGLKEAKPENNEQVKSSDIATEGPATTETDRSNLVNVDIDVQPQKISSSEENRNKGILTIAEGGGEKNEHQMEDKAPTTGIGHEVEVTTAEKPLDSISEDSVQDSYMTPLKDHEPMIIELSRIIEETLARDETTYANAKTPSREKETNENLTQKEDKSIKSKDVSELFSSDDGKEGVNEEVQKHKDADSHMLPKIQNEKNSYDAEDVDISKRGETSDSADQTEVFNTASVSKGNREHILEETDIVKDQSPAFNEKETTEETSKDDQESSGFETTASHIDTEQPNLEEPNITELSSLSVGEVTVKENLNEDESDAMKLKEEVKSSDLEFIEQIRVKELTEESKSGTLQDSAEPNKNIILTSAENSSFVPEVSEKETKEEILKQEEHTNNDFDSASVTVLCEETGLKVAKPENYEQVKSSDIAPEGKGPATIETEETNLDSVDIDVQPEEISGLEENRNKEISTVADGGGEKIEHQMEKEEPPRGIDHDVEVSTAEKPIDSISEDSSRDSYVMPLKDHEPITIVVSKTVEETPEIDVIADVNAKTPSNVQETDEKLIQKEDEPIKPKDVSELFSSDNGTEDANEKVQKLKDAESQMPPELHGEKNSYDTEDLEISQRGETSDLADQTEVSKLDTFTHENPSNEASKDIAISTCKDSEKATLEQEDSVQNLEVSLKGDVLEKGTAELNAAAHSHECEPTNTKDNDQIAEKNLESADLGQKPDFVSESTNKDQSDNTLPQTNKSQTEENKDDVQEWYSESVEQKNIGQIEGETERKMEMEPKLEAKDHIHESQKAEDTITAVSTTEKVHDGVKKVNGSEDIREHATDGDSDVKEIHTVSMRDEIAEKEKDSGPESTEYLKTIDSEEHTETTNTKIAEDPTGETETPVTKAPEEEKIPDESGLEPADVHKGVEDVDESESTREQAIEGESNLKEIHTILAKDEILEKEKDYGLESTERLKASYSKEQTETVNMNIEEDPTGQTKVLITEAPTEVKIPNEDGLEPVEDHQGVEKVNESENITEQAKYRQIDLKETHAIFARDEILEEVKDRGPDSIEYVKTTDSKEQAETVNTNIEKDTMGELEAPVAKALEEEKIKDEGILKPTDEREEVDKTDESEKIKEEATDGDSGLKETHAIFDRYEILEEVKDRGPDSTEYVKTIDSKEQIETVNTNIEKDPMGESEAPVAKAPEEEKIQDESILQRTYEREGVDKIDESENIKEEAKDGDNGLKETHAIFDRDEILEEVKDRGPDSIEYVKATDSKEQIETVKTNIEKDTMGESKAPVAKAPEEEMIQDGGILKSTDEREGVDKTDESENIKEEATDGEATDGDSGLKENHAIFARDEILEEVKDHGPDSIEHVKTTDSKEQIETVTIDIEKDPMGESEAPVAKAPKEEKIPDGGILKPTDEHEVVDKIDESENIKEDATDGDSGLKETHAILARDEIFEEVKGTGPDSIEYVKTTDSKEQIERVNTDIEKDPKGESEAPVAKAPKEEKIQDKGILKSADEREGVDKTNESENIKEEATDGDIGLKETHAIFARDEILEEVKGSGPDSIEYVKTIDSKEQAETVNTNIEKDPMGELEAPVAKALEEEKIRDGRILKPTDEREGVDKTDESENIKEEATDGDIGLKETHAIFARDEILEEVKDRGPDSIEYVKTTDSKEQAEMVNTNIEKDPMGELEAPVAKALEEEKIKDEGILKPINEREEVDKTDESEKIKEEATDGDNGLKETHAIFDRDEILEEVKDRGPDSIEYVKTIDSKEQIETVNTNIEKDPTGESEAPVAKAPEEEKIQDESILKPTDEREGVDKIDESKNIKEEAKDGDTGLKETHAIFDRDEILEEVKDRGPDSIEYVKATDSKEQIETVNTNIEKDPMGESEAPVAKAPKEEMIQDGGILKPTDEREGVDKTDESENIKEEATDGEATDGDSGLKETHAIFARDEILEEVKNRGPDSIEHVKTTDSKEQIETVTTNIEKDPMGESEAPIAKALEEEKIPDGGILKPTDEHEGVDKIDENENIKEDTTDGDNGLKETHAILARDEILEEVKGTGPDSIEYVKTTDSKEQIETVNTDIEKDPKGESEAPVAKAPEEEKIQYKGILKPADEREGVDKTDENENIKEEATDGDIGLKESHAIFARDEILEEVKDRGPDSIEYVMTTDSKEQIETVNTYIEKNPMGESKAPVAKSPKEEKIQNEGIPKLTDEREGVDKTDESENIKVEATDGDNDLKETHAIFARDEILEEVKDHGPDSIEHVKTTDSKEQIETMTTDIEKDPMEESEAPVAKSPEEEKIPDEVILKPTDERDGVDKIDVSENIKEDATDGDSGLKETHAILARDEILEEVKGYGPDSIEFVKTTDSEEQIETVNTDIEKDPKGESEAPVAKAPEEENIQDKGILKPTDEREKVDKTDESENIKEEATDGDIGLKETHAIFARDKILEEVKDHGPDSIENVKTTYSKEQIETVNTDIEKDPMGESKAPVAKSPEEEKIPDEGILKPTDEHEGVDKIDESENIKEDATVRDNGLKETHAIFARDEILEEVKVCGPDSIEYVKTTDSKEQIETVTTDIEKDPMGESEAPVAKAPEEEKIQDESILKPTDEREGVDKTDESENIKEEAKDGDNGLKETHAIFDRDEILEEVKDRGPDSFEYVKTTDSKELIETVNTDIEKDPMGESKAPVAKSPEEEKIQDEGILKPTDEREGVDKTEESENIKEETTDGDTGPDSKEQIETMNTDIEKDPKGESEAPIAKAPKEEKIQDKGILKPTNERKGVDKTDESENIEEEAIDGDGDGGLKETHAIFARDEILEEVKDCGPDSKEQIETMSTDIEKDPMGESEAPVAKAPEEEKIQDEGIFKPTDEREGVDKTDESENIKEDATNGDSGLKETHAIFARDEILEEVKDRGPDSSEYVKTTDSKEQIETVNTDIEKDPMVESKAPVAKSPEEEKIQDEGILKLTDEREGVDKTDESENINEETTDGDSGLKEAHAIFARDEILEEVKGCGPDSIEYVKTTDSKEQIETVNTDIEKDPKGELEAPVAKAPEEEKIQDKGILKPTDEREGVDKTGESENIKEETTDGDSGLKETHAIFARDGILEEVKDCGPDSIEYVKTIDSKEQIETVNTDIEKDPMGESKALEEEKIQDEDILKPTDEREGVDKTDESENIREATDGDSGLKETHAIFARDEILEEVKDCGLDSKEQIETMSTDIEKDPMGESKALVTKAPEEEKIQDKDNLKPTDEHEGVDKTDESENIREEATDGDNGLKETHAILARDEILEEVKGCGPDSIEYVKTTNSKEQIETMNTDIEKDPMGESKVPVTKAPEEEKIQDEGLLKPTDKREGVDKTNESDNIREEDIDGDSSLKEIHTASVGQETIENVEDFGPKSIEYLKATDSKEQTKTVNMNIKKVTTGEIEGLVTRTPEEDSLKPVEVHEEVEKVNESKNIIEQAIDGESGLEEIHTRSIGDEIPEKMNSGPESTEYLKAADSKEQIGTENTNIEEYPTGETEAPFTKALEEEEMKNEGTLKPVDVHEGVEKIDESDNIIQQATDGESNMKNIHTISIEDEKLENVKDSGSESIEYFKEIDSKEHIETENKGIKENPTVETEVPVIKAPKEENFPDEGSLKPVEVHEGVEKVTESENIIEQLVDGMSNLKEIHTISIGDEILDKINNSGPESTEYLKATDSKEQIRTGNTNIEEYPTGETEAPFTKAPEEEEMKDEGTLKPVDVREGVEKVDESDNIRQQATDGESGMKKIHTISIGDEKLENVKDSGSESMEYFKEIDSKEHTETENKGIKEDPTGETEVPVIKAPKEENLPDEGSLQPVEVHEGAEKATESGNIIEQPVDGVSNLKEIHTISIGDEILEKVNDSGLESIEYLKETDSKEQIETLNTDIEKATLEETEALVIKAPEEQKIQDEGSLMTADVHEGVEQVAESENIIQQNKDGENDMEEIHRGSTRDEIFENVQESGPKSTEYLKETNSKEQTKAVNMDIREDTTGEEEGLVKIAEVHEEVEKVNESKNIIEQVKNGESSLKEICTRSTGDEILEKMNDSAPDSTEYPKATDSKEQIITVNKNIEDPTGETKAPEEEEMQDEGILKPADVHEGFEKVDESVHIRQQAMEGESDLIKIHTISTGDKILENVKDSGSESNEYIKATDSMEHTETKNTDIKEDPTWEAEVPFIKEPKEENIPDKGSLNLTEAHEGVEKVHESENNIEQPVDGGSDLKEIHTKKSIGDEILEKVKNFGPESIEYLKETDSKEHIETLNTNLEKDSSSEPEALVTKVPAEEKIQDEGSLNTADAHEGVEQVDESENIIQQNPDGEHYSQEIHTGSTEDEILKNVENSGPESIDTKEDTREIEASLTKEPKEEKIQDEGSLNPTDGHEGVEKVDRSENIREYAIAGESSLKEIHTTFVGDEILEKVKDSDQKSTEYHRATDSKEQIETVNTDIEEDPIQEMEASITKAPEEEKIQDEDSLKPANVHEGVEKANGSENIKEQAIDGESGLKEIYTISVGDGILEKDKDFGPESIKYLKETKSGQEIATVNTNIEEDPIGETEATVTKAQEEEKIQDEGSLKAVDGHEGVEKADGSTNNREQVIDGESDFKEIHEVSLGDDTLNKVKYCSPESTVYLKATDSEEHIETVNTTIKEDPIEETEVPATRALEEEEEEKIQDEGHVKPTNVSVTVTEDEDEKIKEDIKVEEDNFPDNADNAIVIPAESSLGEAQMDDKPVKDTSSDESLKTINAEPCPHAEEVGSMTPEKTSFSLVSQLPNMKHNNIDTETVTPEKPDADEETKTVSDAVFQSKYHGVEEKNETGQSLSVENLDADRTEEGIKEASGTVLESKSLGTEAVTIDEITADQNLPAGKLEEQLQTPSSELLSWEQEHGTTTIVKETEAIKTKEGEILDDKNISDSSATKATEETCLQKEEQPETLSSTFLSTEQEHRTTTTFKKTEEENIKEVKTLEEKGINNSSVIKTTEEACLEQEEPKELAVSKLGLLDGASKLETADKEECEKIKELTSPIEDASNLSFETSEKALETMLDVHSHEALINSEEEMQDEGIVKPEGVSITVAKDSFEYIKEEIKVDNICEKTENATAEVVTAKPSSVESQLNDKSTEDTISDDRVETSTRESNPLAEEVASMKLEKTSSNLPSQLLNVATKNEEKESETLENPDANEVEETKTASDAVFESKYEGVKETGETGESLKVEKLDAADIEEMKETSEISSKSKALGLVEVSEDEVIADQTLPAGNLGEQLQPSSSFLSREEQHGTTVTVKRTEEENMKEVKTPSGEVRKEEGSTLDQASKVEPHVKEEIKYAGSPSETDEIIKPTRPIPSNLNFGITEKAFNYVSEVQSHEVLNKSEDINEKHLQTAIPDLNTEESESQCKKTVEANKILKNEVSIEEVTEEQEFAKDAKSVSLGEETITESHQGYESKSEEYPAEETNKTCKATTDPHQHEALRLSEIIDEGNVSEDIAKTIQVEDRTAENENAAESYLDKVQGETVKEAAMKLELENKSGDTNFTKATTEVMILKEKEAGIEILQKEGTLGIAEVKEITQNIQQLETTSYAASETKIPGEECPGENTGTIITTAHEDVQPVLQHPVDKALEKVELKDTRPGKSTEADAEVREVECEGEKRISDLGEILTEKSTSEDSAKISLSDLMHRSKKENLQVTKDLNKEREPVPSKEEMQNQEAETTVDETKTDEEEGDEHKRTDPGYEAPVMVEAAKEIDVKVVHKKHNILSGVGSKVKHSLSKVKKAITGKSSHPKTSSPK